MQLLIKICLKLVIKLKYCMIPLQKQNMNITGLYPHIVIFVEITRLI